MPNYTSRLVFEQPQATDPVNVETNVNENMDKIDKYINYTICTSTTRPDPPVAGMKIMETDTGSFAIYTGTMWRYLNPGALDTSNIAKGRVDYFTRTGPGISMVTGDPINPQISRTFTAEANRRYWIEMFYNIQQTGASTAPGIRTYINTRVANGASVTNAAPILGKTTHQGNTWGPSTVMTSYRMWEYDAVTAGQKTVGFFWWLDPSDTAGGTKSALVYNSSVEPMRILIRDVGGWT